MKNLLWIVFVAFTAITACKKDNDTQPENYFKYNSNGSITGKITGISYDGIALNENFSLTAYSDKENDNSFKNNNGTYFFNFYRFDPATQTGVTFSFWLSSANVVTTDSSSFLITFNKSIDNNRLLVYRPFKEEIVSIDITNVTFDKTTGRLKGNYVVTVLMHKGVTARNSTVSGSFDVNVIETVYKK